MDVQSLLFSRADGWTEGKAKQWAKAHGYKHGKVDVTDQYVRLRQFDPKGLKIKRTIPFGRGIKAVVAREEPNMAATTKESRRRRPARKARKAREASPKVAAPRRRRTRRTREAAPAVAAPRRRRRTTRESSAAVASPRRRRPRRRRAAAPTSHVMEARRPRRRAPRRAREAWYGDRPGHRKAAKKGWKRRKTRHARETPAVAESRRPRRARRRRAREDRMVMEAHRPRRRARRSTPRVHEAPRRRRASRRAHAYEMPRRYRRSGKRSNPFSGAELALALGTGAAGFIVADMVDRLLATYDPTAATKPTDKFTSDGAGTLANTLNVAAQPTLLRGGVALAMAALPLIGSTFIAQPMLRSSLEGFGIGAGINAFKLLWQNLVMPLLKPADTSTAGLQKSFIARLYPAEIAAAINMAQQPPTQAVSSGGGSGALSGADVGPFALSAESPYPSAAEALRQQAGIGGPGGNFPTLQNTWGTGEFPTAAQAMGVGEAVSNIAQTVAANVPGVTPAQAAAAAGAAAGRPHDIMGALVLVLPHVHPALLMRVAQAIHPHVASINASAAAPAPAVPVATSPAPAAGATSGLYGVGQSAPASTGQPMSAPLTAVPSAPVPVGPPPLPTPGPRVNSPEHASEGCACLSDDNPFLGFIGDGEEETLFTPRAA
jgi:hypothetical protein